MNASDLHRHLEAYLSLRQALGFQIRTQRTLLWDFVRYVEAHGDGGPIRAQWALAWACTSSAQRRISSQAARLQMARGFLIYLRAIAPATEIPEPHLLAAAPRPKPFIFTAAQLQDLIDAALAVGPRQALRPHTLATVFGLMASTGLRVGEALRLTVADVKLGWQPPQLYILETKFHKSRIVPLHTTTADRLRHYAHLRQARHYDGVSDAFFVSEQGKPLTHAALEYWMAKLCRQLNIATEPGGPPPCPRCLRHTFAVRRLQSWHQAGAEVMPLLPKLAVYLGHLRPQHTFWYLTATPELLLAAAERFEHQAALGGDS